MANVDINATMNNFLEQLKTQRYESAKSKPIESQLMRLSNDIGFDDKTNREVWGGNTKDARTISGFILANCQVTDTAKEEITKQIATAVEEIEE